MLRDVPVDQTAAPIRNFTLTTAERIQAVVGGLPAWARRLKRIEDLRVRIVAAHRANALRRDIEASYEELIDLIQKHNAYYPIEANLPFDWSTSRLIDRGKPWVPMPRPSLEELLADGF